MPLDLDLPLSQATFAVVDIETTGLKPPWAKITEIAAVRILDGEIGLEMAQIVDPGCLIPPEIVRMTGITNEMVSGAPTIDDVWPHFQSFIGDAVLVAHNAPFDMGFLDHDCRRITGSILPNPELCTVKISRRAWPWLERHNLDTVAEHLQIKFRSRHRALGDAHATAQLLIESLPLLEKQEIRTVGQLLRKQRSSRCNARLEALAG